MVVRAVQLEWIFLQSMKKKRDMRSQEWIILIRKPFASPLLWKIKISPTHHRDFKQNDGQYIRPSLTKPGNTIRGKFQSLQYMSMELIRAVTGESEFLTADQLQAFKEGKSENGWTAIVVAISYYLIISEVHLPSPM